MNINKLASVKFFMLVFLCGMIGIITSNANAQAAKTQADPRIMFDDFSYRDTKTLAKNGWIVRTADGWPGIPGAKWPDSSVSFVADPDKPGNRILRMTSSTDGTSANTSQAQLCHQRKYLEGTYAARARFADRPVSGPAGDQIVESFYMISPLKAPMDESYSELDFEYLPNGGWGETGPRIFTTSWFTFSPEPNWKQVNLSNNKAGTYAAWHTLVAQVADGKVKYFIDGAPFADHDGKYYPRTMMSINFNLWFIKDGAIKSTGLRTYNEDIDWVFHAAKTALSSGEVEAKVAAFRRKSIGFKDTVPAPVPALDSPCNF